MPGRPHFSYFISHGNVVVTRHSPVWQQPLPLDPNLSAADGEQAICHGEYFSAVRAFLENTGCELISRAIEEQIPPEMKPTQIRNIRICLEKHGAFYHPAHLQVFTQHQMISFVLNVAVSESGMRHISDEYHYIRKLNNEFRHSFLPQVYGIGEISSAGNRKISMFLGQWFEDYHEFHLSRNPANDMIQIAVWHPRKCLFLTFEQAQELYRQVARILAYYYNVETFSQIFPWHHAAGDFTVRLENADLDAKLITVRRYTPFFSNVQALESTAGGPELILQALLIFFLNLSIRTRLDRLDGVGDMVWADRSVVGPTVTGFMEGLALKSPVQPLPDTIERCFRYYLSVCSPADLYDLGTAVANTYHPETPEHYVLRQNIHEHVETLSSAIQQFLT
ncbi:MAG: hypothetical protein JSW26_31055 [Desulfobacterales bacterium]|nr:MAG: hypothetical protein JSW26_31055 [Desulfobacterales bacterium]